MTRLIERCLEGLARAEPDDAALRNLDFRAGLRIASGARLALGGLERPEADERDRLSLLERLGDAFEEGIDGRGRAGLGDAGVLRNFGDQFVLVHARPP